jgi:hypothetical protein
MGMSWIAAILHHHRDALDIAFAALMNISAMQTRHFIAGPIF